MKITEITEAFDSNVKMIVTRATNDMFNTKTEINGRTIIFQGIGYDNRRIVSWEIDFMQKSDDGVTFSKTGDGGEMKVFSFVFASINELVKRYSPDQITFSSHKADGNRTKLYQRMLQRIPLPGYRPLPVDSADQSDDHFTLVKV